MSPVRRGYQRRFGTQPTPPANVSQPTHVSPPPALLVPLAVQELGGFDARLAPRLPLAWTAVCHVRASDVAFTVSTSKAHLAALARCKRLAISGHTEWLALVRAAERSRARPVDLRAWLDTKSARPGWTISMADALGQVTPDDSPAAGPAWSVARVLAAFGADLVSVFCDGDALPFKEG